MVLPNKPVRGSTSGVPIMALFDLLGQRWNLRLMWELRLGPQTFRGLQSACGGVSPSVMNGRLIDLVAAHLVVTGDEGYQLTVLGGELMMPLDPLREWSQKWSDTLQDFSG